MHYRERHHPRRQSVRGSGNGRLGGEPLLEKSTCHGHLEKSFGRRNDRRSLTLQDLKVDLLLLKQGSSVMNFLQRRPCPSVHPFVLRPPFYHRTSKNQFVSGALSVSRSAHLVPFCVAVPVSE